jgi:hypothetical protein
METSLHRELKFYHAVDAESVEVWVDAFRIDAIDAKGALIEIQHASIAALRNKVSQLLSGGHRVRIIKPIVAQKWIETLASREGPIVRRRKSPKRGRAIDVFRELVHFTRVFPQTRLSLELVEVDVLEQRIDRPKHRWKRKAYEIVDQRLLNVGDRVCLASSRDLWKLIGSPKLAQPFDTAELGTAIGEARWFAQQIAYVLNKCGAIEAEGKRGNSILYRLQKLPRRRRTA